MQGSTLRRAGARTMRAINPVGMRVLVRILPTENQTEAGLYLPQGAKESTQESVLAYVEEVASAIDQETSEEENISGIPLNARVLIKREAGVKVPWDDTLRIVETKEVLAIVEEAEIT